MDYRGEELLTEAIPKARPQAPGWRPRALAVALSLAHHLLLAG